MRFGLSVHDVSASELVEIARAAESAGFDSVWLGDHVVVPYGYRTAHPAPEDAAGEPDDYVPHLTPGAKQVDPFVALAAAAAATTRLRVASGIYVLTLRHPLVAARGAATLAELAGGRFILGLGSGWLREEFEALGIPFRDRRGRYDESLEVLRLALGGGAFEYEGRHFQFGRVQVSEHPLRVPLVLGGNSDAALRRAAAIADAWFASGTPTFDEAQRLRERLEGFRREHGRPDPIECVVRVPRLDTQLVERYAQAGFEDVLVWAQGIRTEGDDWGSAVRRAAGRLGL